MGRGGGGAASLGERERGREEEREREFRLPDRAVWSSPLETLHRHCETRQGEPESESGYDCLSGCVAERGREREREKLGGWWRVVVVVGGW